MIQSVLLVMLGFLLAGLIASLLAPSLYKRAARLTTRRIESTMPLTLAEIEADKDLLRASFAIKVRRLESALAKSKDKNASQLVEISRLHMAIAAIQDEAAELRKQLDERRNAAEVFEQTISKRFPELEISLSEAKRALDEQAYEIKTLRSKLQRRDEAVTTTERALLLSQAEVKQLRETLEQGAADQSGRSARRPAQWSPEDFRAEYSRLNLELSKTREQLAHAQEREAHHTVALKTELQQLAQQIMSLTAAHVEQGLRHPGGATPNPRPPARNYGGDGSVTIESPRQSAPAWPNKRHGQENTPMAAREPGRDLGSAEHSRLPTPATPLANATRMAPDETSGHSSSAGNTSAGSETEGDEQKSDAGIRSLLDRLRDVPEPLAGA
jgi:hypothetical protein